jgi:hypothetical protein
MMVPELDSDGSPSACGAALRFVMRDMGNGVQRLEEPSVIQHGWREPMPDMAPDGSALTCYLTPAVLDLAQTALLMLKDRALGYVMAAPLRGIAVFLSDGVAQVTVKLVYVMGTIEAPVGLVLVG